MIKKKINPNLWTLDLLAQRLPQRLIQGSSNFVKTGIVWNTSEDLDAGFRFP